MSAQRHAVDAGRCVCEDTTFKQWGIGSAYNSRDRLAFTMFGENFTSPRVKPAEIAEVVADAVPQAYNAVRGTDPRRLARREWHVTVRPAYGRGEYDFTISLRDHAPECVLVALV